MVHTGQHYDPQMNNQIFEDLKLPKPDISLNIGSASHAVQTAEMMIRLDETLHDNDPDCVVVIGDVNSALAGALTAQKLLYPVAHVESGLRLHDRSLPEEINRIVIDHLSDVLFTQSIEEDKNLRAEGIDKRRIHRVGNVMIDSLFKALEASEQADTLTRFGLSEGGFAVATVHHDENVDTPERLGKLFWAFKEIAKEIPLVFPMHPKTLKLAKFYKILDDFSQCPGIKVTQAIGYLDFIALTKHCRMVLTDSGGVQEETTALGVPCLTLRNETDRQITVTKGTNLVIGVNPEKILQAAKAILAGEEKQGRLPELWDGQTSSRIVDELERNFT